MTNLAPSPVQDKVQTLSRLLVDYATDGADVGVIARSFDSPVVLALEAAREVLMEKQAQVRAVLLQAPPAGWVADRQQLVAMLDLKLALNPRLLEAHEQLVIGRAAVWIGDCMRRDPLKRDAYQQTKIGCSVTSQFAAISFERLWAIGTTHVPGAVAFGTVPAVPRRDVTG